MDANSESSSAVAGNEDVQLNGSTEATPNVSPVLDNLMTRAKTLILELETFRDRLRGLRQDGTVELGHFRNAIQSELNMLERLSNKPTTHSTSHVARSSNLPFLETVWRNAKRYVH